LVVRVVGAVEFTTTTFVPLFFANAVPTRNPQLNITNILTNAKKAPTKETVRHNAWIILLLLPQCFQLHHFNLLL
jgi:hypothetical protein